MMALKDDSDIEIPSDLGAFGYTAFHPNGDWRMRLVRELKGAGYTVDANKLA